MLTIAGLVSWAREHATRLEPDMIFRQGSPGYGWCGEATSPVTESKIKARAYTALDFLDRFAGADSQLQWAVRGRAAFEKNEHSRPRVHGSWVTFCEPGRIRLRQA
jgi:hypothetical protein